MNSISKLSSALVVTVLTFPICSVFASPQEDSIPERPKTEMILPETTVAMVQLPDFQAAVGKMRETGAGKMMTDDSIASLVDGLMEEAELAYDDVKDDVGIELSDLKSLPDGEITFAVIAPRRANPEYMIIMDLNGEEGVLDRVMKRGREMIPKEENAPEDDEEDFPVEEGFEIESFNADGRRIHFFQRENTIVASTSTSELYDLIDRWMGREVEKTRPLASNRKFVTIMNRCAGTQDLDPEFRFFVDPIAVAKSSTRGNASARFTINLLPLLGFDSLSAIGGAMFLDEEEYESVMHAHVLLTNPRTGIFALLAFRPTEYEPEDFIPQSTVNHMMVSLDAPKAYAELTKIVDSFMSPGAFESAVDKNVNEELGLDLKEDIINSIDGRITWFQWIEEPAIINSTRSGMAFRLKDPEKFEMLMDKMTERFNNDFGGKDKTSDSIEKRDYRDITIYAEPRSKVDARNNRDKERKGRRRNRKPKTSDFRSKMERRIESPQMAIFGDCLVISFNSNELMKTMIDTFQGEGERLIDDQNYGRIVDESHRLLNNELPMANFYSDPKRQLKWFLELADADQTKEVLTKAAESNKFISGIMQRIEENPLPPFEQLGKYLSQSGGFMSDDDTGLHMLFFTLKSEE